MKIKKGLGRGLSALISPLAVSVTNEFSKDSLTQVDLVQNNLIQNNSSSEYTNLKHDNETEVNLESRIDNETRIDPENLNNQKKGNGDAHYQSSSKQNLESQNFVNQNVGHQDKSNAKGINVNYKETGNYKSLLERRKKDQPSNEEKIEKVIEIQFDKNKLNSNIPLENNVQSGIKIESKNKSENEELSNNENIQFVDIKNVINNPNQPRQIFSPEEIEELANSIKIYGVLQPILVRKNNENYEIIAGERRWRASQKVGLKNIPVLIKDLNDFESLKISLIENIQRSQLNPIEEANAYEKLINEHSLTQDQLSEALGKNRVSIANMLRLLKLPKEIQLLVQEGKISTGHSKVILSVKEPSVQIGLAKKVMNETLSVRQLEDIVARIVILDSGTTNPANKKNSNTKRSDSASYNELLERLRHKLGTKVTIQINSKKNGRICLDFFSEDDLSRISDLICNEDNL